MENRARSLPPLSPETRAELEARERRLRQQMASLYQAEEQEAPPAQGYAWLLVAAVALVGAGLAALSVL